MSIRLNFHLIVGTIILYSLMLVANELLFAHVEFARGIGWVYLPAGMRLLCTLLFGGAGTVGLLIAGWAVCFFYYFPDDFIRSFMGGLLGAVAPYLVYRIAQHVYGLRASLTNLTPKRLLICAVACSIASPLLHHIWFAFHGESANSMPGFFVMVAGDLAGTLIVVYTAKILLSLLPARPSIR